MCCFLLLLGCSSIFGSRLIEETTRDRRRMCTDPPVHSCLIDVTHLFILFPVRALVDCNGTDPTVSAGGMEAAAAVRMRI
jgi:hypothetical protein